MPTHFITYLLAVAVTAQVYAAPIEVVQNGTSDYVIFHELTAPQSLAEAATVLQKHLQRASGAKLPVVHQPARKMICLGDSAAARGAGVSTESILMPSIDYGFTLARPAVRKQWEKLLHDWTLTTNNISYYDLPVNITTEAGALNPPGLEILKSIYPKLTAAHIKGVYIYGVSAWGRAAPLNYLLDGSDSSSDYYHVVIAADTASFMIDDVWVKLESPLSLISH